MNKPIIGITTYGRNDKNRIDLPIEYIDAIVQAGGIPYLLPPSDVSVDAILKPLDGLMISGGGDIDPVVYHGELHETLYNVDRQRDYFEIALTKAAIKSTLPILGICRGVQIINIAEGGSLHAHLPDVVGEQVLHRAPPREPIPHEVIIKSGTKLAGIVKKPRFNASSWHHQAIKKIAPSLIVSAIAPDEVIEAIEMPGHPWLVAVQWHPEHDAAEDFIQQQLFKAFVVACQAS